MCIFVPSKTTRRIDRRWHAKFEIIVFKISTEDAIRDAIEGTNLVIDRIHILISKNTNRKSSINGFL